LILKNKNELELLTILHQITNLEEYKLNSKYLEKFSSRSKLAARILTIVMKAFSIFIYTGVIILTATAYLDSEMNFSIFIMWIWFVILIICLNYAITVLFVSNAFMYLIALYINYRFRQVQDLIEIYLERGITYKIF